METVNNSLIGSMDPILKLEDMYANNPTARKQLLTSLLTSNPFNPDTEFEIQGVGSNNLVLNSLMYSIGLRFDLDNDEDDISQLDRFKDMDDDQFEQFMSDITSQEKEKKGSLSSYLDTLLVQSNETKNED